MKKPFKIEFAPSSKIDSFAHELIKELFGIEGAFLSDESALEDFLEENDIPGHKLIRFKDIPKEDRAKLIKKIEKLYGISMVGYPKEDLLYIWKVVAFIKKKLAQN